MRHIGLLLSVVTLCLLSALPGCAPTIPKGQEYKVAKADDEIVDKNAYLKAIRPLPWGEQKIKLLDILHSMRILAPGVYEKIRVLNPLDSLYDKPRIDSIVEKYWKKDQDILWAPHTPDINERRDTFEVRLELVKQLGYTTPGIGYLERPAEFILILGPPNDQWETRDEPCGITGRTAVGTEIPCPKLYMEWWTSPKITVAFEPDEDGEYNTVLHENMTKEGSQALQKVAVVEHQVLTKEPVLDIYKGIEWFRTGVDVSAFPNSIDTTIYTVYITTGMPSKELRKLSIKDTVNVKYSLVVYDSKDSVILNDSLILDPILTSVLRDDNTWYRFYTNLSLPRGKYTVTVAVSSLDGKKLDIHRVEKNIPPSLSGMGDILISDRPPMIKDNIVMKQGGAWNPEGIWRPGGLIIPQYPFGIATGDTFYVYIEPLVEPDADGMFLYTIECFLLPTKGKRKGEVELGEPEYFFSESEEAKRIEKGLLESKTEEMEIKGKIILFSMKVKTKEKYFIYLLSIPPSVETGVYSLTATVKHKGGNNLVWKEIRIEQKKSYGKAH